MSTTKAAEKSIVVRALQRRRYTDTDGRTVRHIIRFNGPILSSDLGGMKEGDQVTLWIEETPQTQVAIGSITTDEEHREQLAPEIQLTLPHAAFTDFWNAASSTDSALRNVTLKIEDAMMGSRSRTWSFWREPPFIRSLRSCALCGDRCGPS